MAEGKLADPIGLPLDRVDGQLKVTGRATYAFEYAAQGGGTGASAAQSRFCSSHARPGPVPTTSSRPGGRLATSA